MSTHVVGIKSPDDRFRQMLAIWNACMVANIATPKEVADFFEGVPDSSGVLVPLDGHIAVNKYEAEMASGYEIDLQALPKDIKIIRFYNSY